MSLSIKKDSKRTPYDEKNFLKRSVRTNNFKRKDIRTDRGNLEYFFMRWNLADTKKWDLSIRSWLLSSKAIKGLQNKFPKTLSYYDEKCRAFDNSTAYLWPEIQESIYLESKTNLTKHLTNIPGKLCYYHLTT